MSICQVITRACLDHLLRQGNGKERVDVRVSTVTQGHHKVVAPETLHKGAR